MDSPTCEKANDMTSIECSRTADRILEQLSMTAGPNTARAHAAVGDEFAHRVERAWRGRRRELEAKFQRLNDV
jgi:hypothetical protein